jgi:ABC-type phosphate transport system permease subunit
MRNLSAQEKLPNGNFHYCSIEKPGSFESRALLFPLSLPSGLLELRMPVIDIHDVIFAKETVWQLGMFGCVSIVGFCSRSRVPLVTGATGMLLGFVIPEPRIYADYRTVEAAVLAGIHHSAAHTIFWSGVGATIGVIAGLFLSQWMRRQRESRLVAFNNGES